MRSDFDSLLRAIFLKIERPQQALDFLCDVTREDKDEERFDILRQMISRLQQTLMRSHDPHAIQDHAYEVKLPGFPHLWVGVRHYAISMAQHSSIELVFFNLQPQYENKVRVGYEVIHDIACALQKQLGLTPGTMQWDALYQQVRTASILVGDNIEVELSKELPAQQLNVKEMREEREKSPRQFGFFVDSWSPLRAAYNQRVSRQLIVSEPVLTTSLGAAAR